MAAEIMFRPELVDVETPGISENVFNCIQVGAVQIFCNVRCRDDTLSYPQSSAQARMAHLHAAHARL